MEEIVNLISNLGFPIACVLGLSYFIFKVWNTQRDDKNEQLAKIVENNSKREERLYQQMDKYNEILSDVAETLARIDTRIEILEKSVNNNLINK